MGSDVYVLTFLGSTRKRRGIGFMCLRCAICKHISHRIGNVPLLVSSVEVVKSQLGARP